MSHYNFVEYIGQVVEGENGLRKISKVIVSLAVASAAIMAPTGAMASTAPLPTEELKLERIARYSGKSQLGKNGVEIVTYDAATKKAYIVNGDPARKSMEIIDLSGLAARTAGTVTELVYQQKIGITSLGITGFDDLTSIAVHPTKNLIAVAVLAAKPNKGYVAFFDKNGNFLSNLTVEVGYHPDMLTFTPDGNKLLVANEGEPTDDTYADDPVGSVSIIDVSNEAAISQSKVLDIPFELTEAQIDSNVRIYPFGPTGKFAGRNFKKDFEPEYIAVAPDNSTAYVVLQEANAIAKLDLTQNKFVHIYGLGNKDHSLPGNEIDASDKDGVDISKQPLLGTYMPDGMSIYQAGGKTYLVTANEGDSKDYKPYKEEYRVKELAAAKRIRLDARYYKGYTQAELDAMLTDGTFTDDKKLGRMNVTTAVYDSTSSVTGAVYIDALYTLGARSFSIWDVEKLQSGPVYDSGSDFERIVAGHPVTKNHVNADNEGNAADDRSDNKGVEPEDAEIGELNGQKYAFVGLERQGGIMVYNISDPKRTRYVAYQTDRDFTGSKPTTAVDVGPEGLQFVPADKSPTGKALLLVANETSGSLSVYEITPAKGKYVVSPKSDAAYTVGTAARGVKALTVAASVTGFKLFTVDVTTEAVRAGEETVLFKHLRGNVQIGLSAVKTDLDNGAGTVSAGFNVAPGDVVEVYVVDELTNNPAQLPVILQ
jgi:hypothetical protein